MNEEIQKIRISNSCLLSGYVTTCNGLFNEGGSSDQAGEGITTVTMWHGLTSIDLDNMNKVVKAFEEKNPTIKMNLVYTESNEGSDQKLLTAVAGGNPPDVALFDRFKVGTWAAQGSLTDLSSMAAESGIRKEMYYPFAWEVQLSRKALCNADGYGLSPAILQ